MIWPLSHSINVLRPKNVSPRFQVVNGRFVDVTSLTLRRVDVQSLTSHRTTSLYELKKLVLVKFSNLHIKLTDTFLGRMNNEVS